MTFAVASWEDHGFEAEQRSLPVMARAWTIILEHTAQSVSRRVEYIKRCRANHTDTEKRQTSKSSFKTYRAPQKSHIYTLYLFVELFVHLLRRVHLDLPRLGGGVQVGPGHHRRLEQQPEQPRTPARSEQIGKIVLKVTLPVIGNVPAEGVLLKDVC